MNLADKLNINVIQPNYPEECKRTINETRDSFHIDENIKTWHIACDSCRLCLLLYLLNRNTESYSTASNISSICCDYLLGEWQKFLPTSNGIINPELWRTNLAWFRPIRRGMLWASAIYDFAGVDRMLSFLNEECSEDEAGDAGKMYYIGLKNVFENSEHSKCEVFSACLLKVTINDTNRQHERLLRY